ncbi:hypothetical protein ES704_02240 [subsurface metagenome]|jgi:hypothetical protein
MQKNSSEVIKVGIIGAGKLLSSFIFLDIRSAAMSK